MKIFTLVWILIGIIGCTTNKSYKDTEKKVARQKLDKLASKVATKVIEYFDVSMLK